MVFNKKSKYNITYSELLNSTLFISLLMTIIATHTVLDNLAMASFISVVFILRYKKLNNIFNIYFIMEIIFVLYSYWQIKFGIAINEDVAMTKVITLIISLIYYIAIYIYILGSSQKKKIIEIIVKAIFAGLLIVLLCDIQNIFTGRFGTNVNAGVSILGIRIGRLNSTYIGQISGIALYLSMMIYLSKKKSKAIFYAVFFTFMILISATRKVLFIILIAYIAVPYLYNKRKNFIKLISSIILCFILVFVGYKLITGISFLYNLIGVRIDNVIEVLVKGETTEASFNTREKLVEKGIQAFEKKPITGWGLDNFRYVINNGGYYAHNNFIEILVSGGLVGFIIYYLKYVYLILETFICKNKKLTEDYLDIKVLRVLLITLIILEYWQVTYYYRLFLLPFIITLAFTNKTVKEK